MRRAATAMVLVLLLATKASAQVAAGQPARTAPPHAEISTQATFDTSYLLVSYMTQLAAAGAAPSQADIDEATRQYFTNGAALTTVPSSGPGAAYFHDGATAAGVPSSGPGAAYFHNGAEVMAYYPAPRVAPAPDATGEAGGSFVGSKSPSVESGVQRAVASTEQAAPAGTDTPQTASTAEARAGALTATGLTCSPREIEAAMAIASQFATAAESPASAASCAPATTLAPALPHAETVPTSAAEPANCPPGRSLSLLSRIAAALGGAFLGGLAVALWSRPRPLRVTQSR